MTGVSADVGDVLVCKAGMENADQALNTPTGGTGLTWTLQASPNAGGGASVAPVYLWTAVATAALSAVTITVTGTPATVWCGAVVRRWSGSDGVGAANGATGSGTPSVAVTTTQANSALDVVSADWNAVDGATRTWLQVNGLNAVEVTYARDASFGTAYGAYWTDAGTAGSKTAGLSAPGGQLWAAAVVEVLGTSGAAPDPVPRGATVVPGAASMRAATW